MFKKIIAALLLAALVISMAGCGNSVPENLTEETYELGKQALKVMDNYLAGKIDVMTASDELLSISDALDAEHDMLQAKADAGGTEGIEAREYSFYNGSVSFCISSFALGMFGEKGYDCQEERDHLADILEVD